MQSVVIFTAFVSGLTAGVLIRLSARHGRSAGSLRIDRSDPDSPPLLFLELHTDVQTIMQKRYVTFRVKVKNLLSRK